MQILIKHALLISNNQLNNFFLNLKLNDTLRLNAMNHNEMIPIVIIQ
jgi:hypothetical protein